MILNISGRTDIVAFYTPWLMNRLAEGYVMVRNPYNSHSISQIYFKDVDLIVFCTKDPRPILPYLKDISIPYVFQVTFTPYHQDIEPGVRNKKAILKAILELDHPILRYDPILINERYTVDYHIRAFTKLCEIVDGKVDRIILSFVDEYRNVKRHVNDLNLKQVDEQTKEKLLSSFVTVARQHGIVLQSCYEGDLSRFGVSNEPCLSVTEAFHLTGKIFPKWKARSCGCVSMVDIGDYNCCKHYCRYCYANYDESKIASNCLLHDPNNDVLIGSLDKYDIIKRRRTVF